jgi:DNA-3-methyladenine glycosylase II
MHFEYGGKEIGYLKQKDTALAQAIEKIGFVKVGIDTDIFSAAANSIIGQQMSMAAQTTIWNRLKDKVGAVTVESVLALSLEELKSIGISYKKAEYILGFAEQISSGSFSTAALATLPDDQVIEMLSSVKGIGVWTAEMLLIFSLGRQDVLSFGDLAIHRGLAAVLSLWKHCQPVHMGDSPGCDTGHERLRPEKQEVIKLET